jgi:AcrR family transcriptional regulator
VATVSAPARRDPYSVDTLVEVVAQEFLRRGYDATSMADISEATGRTKSTIYHYVTGKEELLRLAISRAVDALFAVLDEPPAKSGPAIDRLEHVIRRSTQVLAQQLPYVTLLLRVRGNTETEQWALARRREFDKRLAKLVQAAIREGDVRSDLDPKVVTRLLFGMVNSLTEWFHPGGTHSLAEVESAVVALALDGMRPR